MPDTQCSEANLIGDQLPPATTACSSKPQPFTTLDNSSIETPATIIAASMPGIFPMNSAYQMSPHTSSHAGLGSLAAPINQQPCYTSAHMMHEHTSLYNRAPSYVMRPQLNSTFAYPSGCVYGQSRQAPNSTIFTSIQGGNDQRASQLPVDTLQGNVGAAYIGPYGATAPYQPVSPVHGCSGQPHGGSASVSDSTWGGLYAQPRYNFDVSLTPSQAAARHVLSKDLPLFSGKPEEWPLFITNYEQSTERCGFTEQENLIRLQKSLRGAALEAVRGKLMMPSTVHLAIATLRMLFGRPDVIHDTLQRKLRQMPPVKTDRLHTLIDLALGVQNYRATMQALGLSDYLNDPMLINELLTKLPGDMKLDWGRRRMATARVDIVAFDDWLFGLASCASQVTPLGSPTFTTGEEKAGRRANKERVLIHDNNTNKHDATKTSCHLCGNDHNLSECQDFKSKSRNERWQVVKDKILCIRCFKPHLLRRCASKQECGVDGCRMAHNPLLHSRSSAADNSKVNKNDTKGNEGSTVLFHRRTFKRAIFRYIPVTLYGPTSTLETFALIDEGASCTLMGNGLAEQLGLDGPSEELCLRWTGDITQQEANSKFVGCEISGRGENSTRYRIRNVRTITNLELPQQSLNSEELAEHRHLRPSLDTNCRARLLIGLDNTKLSIPLEVHQAEGDDLVAAGCKLGWSVYGHNNSDHPLQESLLHVCPCTRDKQVDSLMKTYFSIESIGTSPTAKPLRSKADERAYAIMQNTVKYKPDEKRWETGLLWRYDQIDLPDSFQMAYHRLQCLERKMERCAELKEFVIEKMNHYLDRGYVRKLSHNEVSKGGKSWFIPMFTVRNLNKNKRRIVWDAAAKVQNTSLNDVLLTGPDLLRSMVGVLIRFRERPVAICGDIREMFHQIHVRKEDQVAQQFLWRDGDTSRRPDVFAMTVMTFGRGARLWPTT